jgi:hypothetical protein
MSVIADSYWLIAGGPRRIRARLSSGNKLRIIRSGSNSSAGSHPSRRPTLATSYSSCYREIMSIPEMIVSGDATRNIRRVVFRRAIYRPRPTLGVGMLCQAIR